MIYDLSNPSDAVTFVGDDSTLAGVAALILGHGAYGLTDEQGATVLPVMLFGGVEKWLEEQRIGDLGDYLNANRTRMADFLDSVRYCDVSERKRYGDAVQFDDDRRTSMNNIGANCKKLAERLRQLEQESAPATADPDERAKT